MLHQRCQVFPCHSSLVFEKYIAIISATVSRQLSGFQTPYADINLANTHFKLIYFSVRIQKSIILSFLYKLQNSLLLYTNKFPGIW